MEVLLTSLDALLHKATGANLERPDPAALEAFCTILSDSPNGAYIATRVIASRIRSPHPTEALLTLEVLDACMKRCDASFHAEVDKFRFLNEMIKLVSPKYYGNETAPAVRQKILSLMHSWTVDYPREIKIKDAYEMLKKQGVVKDTPPPPPNNTPITVNKNRTKDNIFEDEERSKMLQKLLQSKNPDDLQAANRLIKTMVREGERKIEAVTRQVTELQTIHNNIRLLDEMLDQYRPSVSSHEDLELIKELHSECTRLRPTVFKLASETQQNEDILTEVLEVSDDMSKVLDKYSLVILQGKPKEAVKPLNQTNQVVTNGEGSSLLDLATPLKQSTSKDNDGDVKKSNLEELGDIFSIVDNSKKYSDASEVNSIPTLQPVSLITSETATNSKTSALPANKGLDELNALGECLLKSSLPPSCKTVSNFTNQRSDKVPMNLMGKTQPPTENATSNSKDQSMQKNPCDLLDLDYLISKTLQTEKKSAPQNLSSDDIMVDISSDDNLLDSKEKISINEPDIALLDCLKNVEMKDEAGSSKDRTENDNMLKISPLTTPTLSVPSSESVEVQAVVNKPNEVKPLNDISITLDAIKPSEVPPLTVFEEERGLTVTLHFAKNKPRSDVSVIVASTTSRNPHPIEDYKFHAVVPKSCKIRQLPQSGSSFPAFTPFLPPAAVTQILLIARPDSETPTSVFLKFVITYMCQDESISEIGEVNDLPLSQI